MLVVLCTAWAILERQAPVVSVQWREGLSEESRRQTERDLYLERTTDHEGDYELGSPRRPDIAAIVAHPDVDDTHRIDRAHATLTVDSYRGTRRVWWAGPFKGFDGPVQFRVVLVLIGFITLVCARLSGPARLR